MESWMLGCLDACVIVCLLAWWPDSCILEALGHRFVEICSFWASFWRPLEVHGSNFEALGAPCIFLGVLWVAGLPRGAQNELIELPVQAAAPIYRDSVDSGGGGGGYPP